MGATRAVRKRDGGEHLLSLRRYKGVRGVLQCHMRCMTTETFDKGRHVVKDSDVGLVKLKSLLCGKMNAHVVHQNDSSGINV